MRKERDARPNSRGAWGQMFAGITLASLTICATLIGHFWLSGIRATAPGASPSSTSGPYLYFVLKQTDSFVLARAHANANGQPTEMPRVIASFGDAFGQSTADSVISLQTSPDGHYLAIDGTHSDCELLWILDTLTLKLRQVPSDASGTFLHWLPGTGELFLYRPMLPLGPETPDMNNWNPGLWIGNAATDTFTNLDINVPSTFLVDAIGSPDGSQIVYSTSGGLGLGSDIWMMDLQGQHVNHLLQISDEAQSIAGMFAWSPDGQHIAYERLDDSPTPFLPAGLWLMDRQGQNQRLIAQADGGHGFPLSWSPDGAQVAFVERTNPTTSMADQSLQALQSAVDVVDVSSGRVQSVASPVETGAQINVNPIWNRSSTQITFAAFNPLNPELGGSVRYWSFQVKPGPAHPSVAEISQPITHVIAPGQ